MVATPEILFAARVPGADPPRPRPATRRGVFFDVENTSRLEHVAATVDHLQLEWSTRVTDFVAVGNWRVIGPETARLLAGRGAQLVHSAPSTGVRDWSDLRIAVAAGAWLAAGRPGDLLEVVSDDQAFDAVGDVAAALGVAFRRVSPRAVMGAQPAAAAAPAQAAERDGGRGRRRRRGRRGRPAAPAPPAPAARPAPPPPPVPVVEPAGEAHTAPVDEIRQLVEDLLDRSPGGVSLDALANALKSRGFRRPPGSPRLITRLRHLKSFEVSRSGMVRLVDSSRHHGGHRGAAHAPVEEVEAEPAD